jgi:signal transduction histidine kinase
MKDFAHPDGQEMTPVDLNLAIRSTLIIARSEYKHVAEVETELEEGLPLVICHGGEINQVVLNLLVNAVHAVGDANAARGGARGRIVITTRTDADGEHVAIAIADSGTGIPEHVRAKIFEPFFTTKEVGRGTGQGLAIARGVVQKHGGTIDFETAAGVGTTFLIRLPIQPRPKAASAPHAQLAAA